MASANNFLKNLIKPLKWAWRLLLRYLRTGWWQKLIVTGVVFFALCIAAMYGIAVWYQHEQKGKPTVLGVTFIADYASYLGTNPHQAFLAILDDLHVKHLRLVSYWSDIEPVQGQYNFSELDWEMSQAQSHGAKVTLAIGLRQPRWPECHPPSWVNTAAPESTWEPELNAYITAVVNRYKHNPALQSYQLENEFFNTFGDCNNYDRTRLNSELALVKRLDPNHPVIITRSDNYAGFSLRKPLPDIIGISVYRHVWNTVLVKRYFTYPFPSWYYAFLAGAQQTGIKQIDYWGAEYWYYRMVVLHDPSVWNEAKQIFNQQT